MPYSYVEYTGNGSNTTFAIPFGYINEADIEVTVDDVEVDFEFTSQFVIDTDVAPDADAEVVVRRISNQLTPETTFSNGSVRTAAQMNKSVLQNFYLIQEFLDNLADEEVFAIADGAVTTAKLDDLAVNSAKLGSSSVTTAKIGDDQVTYAKIQDVSATDKILGRSTAGSGIVEEITCTATGRSILDDASVAAVRTTLGVPADACQFCHVHRNGSDATISDASWTKINYTTEVFDTASAYDLTDDRFTPTVAGKYLCVGSAGYSGLSSGDLIRSAIYKNGSSVAENLTESTGSNVSSIITQIVDMNGTTDYLEHYTHQDGTGSKTLSGSTDRTYFQCIRISA